MQLYGFFRSSASYRVRIALALKGQSAEPVSKHLRRGEQRAADFLQINPQGLLPVLVTDQGEVLTQSLAIIEWLDETYPDPPLVPRNPLQRARIRAFAQVIACDTHPVQNLKILQMLRAKGCNEDECNEWARTVNAEGLRACEVLLQNQSGVFCFGARPTLADICLIPQMFNARRFGLDTQVFPRLTAVEAACQALPSFQPAAPDQQADAE